MIICPWKDIMRYAPVMKGLEEAVAAVNALTEYEDKKNYPLSDGNRFFITVATTKAPDLAEAHRNYVDIQYVVEGKESIEIAPVSVMEVTESYIPERDVEFYADKNDAAKFVLTAGGYAILYPADAHKPGVRVGESVPVKKMVGKVRI